MAPLMTAALLGAAPLPLLLLLPPAGATVPLAGESPSARVQAHCVDFLARLSATGHSRFELSALCRARLPKPVCHDALGSLGQSPWTEGQVAATCRGVQSRWHERFLQATGEGSPGGAESAAVATFAGGAESFSEVQVALDEAMRAKSAVGVCTDMQLDECAQYKAREFPAKAREIERTLTLKYQFWNGEVGNMGGLPQLEEVASPASPMPHPEEKFEEADVGRLGGPNRALVGYACAVTALLLPALVGLALLRMPRTGSRRSRGPRRGRARGGVEALSMPIAGGGAGSEEAAASTDGECEAGAGADVE